jgi:hypothetical protein
MLVNHLLTGSAESRYRTRCGLAVTAERDWFTVGTTRMSLAFPVKDFERLLKIQRPCARCVQGYRRDRRGKRPR